METIKNNYKINAVILGLLERRKSHQINMLKATSLIIIFALLFTGVLLHLSYKSSSELTNNITDIKISSVDKIDSGNSQRESINNIKNILPYQHDGFAGFNGYKISPSSMPDLNLKLISNSPNISFQTADIYMDDFRNELHSLSEMQIESYGSGDFGLPKEHTLIQLAWDRFPVGAFSNHITLKEPDEPAFIKLTEKPHHPADAYEISGKVVLEFIITKSGTVKNRIVLNEAPQNLGFARAVLSALNEAYYWPAKNNGNPIDTKVILTWDMCWNCNYEITYSDERLIVTKD